MKFNYDLIVIGINQTGLLVAEYALKLGARVAIVAQIKRCDRSLFFSFISSLKNEKNVSDWHDIFQIEKKKFEQYLEDLQLLGLDVCHQEFSVHNQGKIVKIINKNNQLFSPVSIIALSKFQLFNKQISPPSEFSIYQQYFDLLRITKLRKKNILIKGNNLESIYLINILLSLDKSTVLIFNKHQQILPYEDEDISWHLQLNLEAKGVKIFDKHYFQLKKSQEINTPDWLTINTEKDGLEMPTYLAENLGIKWKNKHMEVNEKLQTRNHKIYGCGEILGGYNLDALNEYEAKIAVENSLFFPLKSVNYDKVGYTLNINPPLYRIGYTEKQVRKLTNTSFYVIQFCLNFDYDREGDFLKIIISNDDYILGFHGLGENLRELFNFICYIYQNNVKISSLFTQIFTKKNTYKILKKIKNIYLEKKKKQNQIIINFRETFLLWKRP